MMPQFLLSLDEDPENEVFTSIAEFYKHHEGLGVDDAREKSNPHRVALLFKHEMSKTPAFRATLDGRVI